MDDPRLKQPHPHVFVHQKVESEETKVPGSVGRQRCESVQDGGSSRRHRRRRRASRTRPHRVEGSDAALSVQPRAELRETPVVFEVRVTATAAAAADADTTAADSVTSTGTTGTTGTIGTTTNSACIATVIAPAARVAAADSLRAAAVARAGSLCQRAGTFQHIHISRG